MDMDGLLANMERYTRDRSSTEGLMVQEYMKISKPAIAGNLRTTASMVKESKKGLIHSFRVPSHTMTKYKGF